jgi:glycolate oxidase FAD binding subunit
MRVLTPGSPAELAETLAAAANAKQSITLGGQFTKRLMAGPTTAADVTISTARMTRILKYEPRDLTLSVEAGTPFAEVSRVLAANNQMIPLDPPWAESATVGGVIATNGSGPRRRLYGTARDMVIGLQFATLEGKLVQSGGMVVKNVAGLDMGKLMIGSFGTLAAIAVVNFKVAPRPEVEQTSLLQFETAAQAIAARDRILQSVLQPMAVDLLNPLAAAPMGLRGYILALQYGGNEQVVQRYAREFEGAQHLQGPEEQRFWKQIQSGSQRFTEKFTEGAVVRISAPLTQLEQVLSSLEVPVIARAATGVSYAYFNRADAAAKWMAGKFGKQWPCVMEFSTESEKAKLNLWPSPGSDFAMMKKVKQLFDPANLLNHGRLYRLI